MWERAEVATNRCTREGKSRYRAEAEEEGKGVGEEKVEG